MISRDLAEFFESSYYDLLRSVSPSLLKFYYFSVRTTCASLGTCEFPRAPREELDSHARCWTSATLNGQPHPPHPSPTRLLRPTQFGGATYGGGWSRKTGKWFEVLENHGYHILRRGMGPQCKACLRNAMKDNTYRQPNCRDSATKGITVWKERCTGNLWEQCAPQDCFPQQHWCHNGPFIDHRVHPQAWRVMSEGFDNSARFLREPNRLCVDKLFMDKLKQVSGWVVGGGGGGGGGGEVEGMGGGGRRVGVNVLAALADFSAHC